MTQAAPRYAMLTTLSAQTSSEGRRELLRTVTDALGRSATPASDAEFAQLDGVLSAVAQEYSVQVRTEFARMVAGSVTRFCESAQKFALDDIAVAAPVLKHAQSLSEDTLMKVVAEKSQAHMLAVTQRASISPRISHALVERGDDTVVTSLLANDNAQIADNTYEAVAKRAGTSATLQAPLVGRKGVPMDLLNDLYHKVEAGLRQEIIKKFDQVPPGELEKAFERSRARVTQAHRQMPEDFAAARKRVAALEGARQLAPPILATLLREGAVARTAFKLVLARLADVDFDPADRCIESGDLDTLALLCRGGGFDRGLFVTLAVGLDKSDKGLANAEAFGRLYESVPIQAAQRALRFWKVRAA